MSGETKNANYTRDFEFKMKTFLKRFYTIKYEISVRNIILRGVPNF